MPFTSNGLVFRDPGQSWGHATGVSVATTETRFYSIMSAITSTTENSVLTKTRRRMVVTGFSVKLPINALVSAEAITFTLRKNGADTGQTLVVDTATGTVTTVDSTGAPVEYQAGDTICLKGIASALGGSRNCSFVTLVELNYL